VERDREGRSLLGVPLAATPLCLPERVAQLPLEPALEKKELAALFDGQDIRKAVKESLPFRGDLLVDSLHLIEHRQVLGGIRVIADEPFDFVERLVSLLHEVPTRRLLFLETGEEPDRLVLFQIEHFNQPYFAELLDPLPAALSSRRRARLREGWSNREEYQEKRGRQCSLHGRSNRHCVWSVLNGAQHLYEVPDLLVGQTLHERLRCAPLNEVIRNLSL